MRNKKMTWREIESKKIRCSRYKSCPSRASNADNCCYSRRISAYHSDPIIGKLCISFSVPKKFENIIRKFEYFGKVKRWKDKWNEDRGLKKT